MSIRFEKVGKEFPKLDMLDELNRRLFRTVNELKWNVRSH